MVEVLVQVQIDFFLQCQSIEVWALQVFCPISPLSATLHVAQGYTLYRICFVLVKPRNEKVFHVADAVLPLFQLVVEILGCNQMPY